MAPEGWSGPALAPRPARVDGTLVKALARAHRWQGMLEGGEYGSIEELARAERINPSYLARVLRLTLLAPDIVESILDGRHDPERITLDRLMRPFTVEWRTCGKALDRPLAPITVIQPARTASKKRTLANRAALAAIGGKWTRQPTRPRGSSAPILLKNSLETSVENADSLQEAWPIVGDHNP